MSIWQQRRAAYLIERGRTEELAMELSNDKRCGLAGCDLPVMKPRASYCCVAHSRKAARQRAAERRVDPDSHPVTLIDSRGHKRYHKLACTCGTCRACKVREYVRAWRGRERNGCSPITLAHQAEIDRRTAEWLAGHPYGGEPTEIKWTSPISGMERMA